MEKYNLVYIASYSIMVPSAVDHFWFFTVTYVSHYDMVRFRGVVIMEMNGRGSRGEFKVLTDVLEATSMVYGIVS